jgi:Heavy-metal resistance
MKRGAVILLVVLGVGAAMGALSYGFFRDRISATDWLQKEFSLNEEQSARILALNAEYGLQCKEMCAHIAQADSRLAGLIDSSRTVTQEIREALVETDRVRSECRLKMLEHFYEVAAAMPEEERKKYLDMVLRVVLKPGEMDSSH